MSRPARKISSAALIVFAAAGMVEAANSNRAIVDRGCGTVIGGGRTWQVSAVAFPCADAKTLIRKLIRKVPRSGAAALGTYSTMRCTAALSVGQHAIMCSSASGKIVEAFAK